MFQACEKNQLLFFSCQVRNSWINLKWHFVWFCFKAFLSLSELPAILEKAVREEGKCVGIGKCGGGCWWYGRSLCIAVSEQSVQIEELIIGYSSATHFGSIESEALFFQALRSPPLHQAGWEESQQMCVRLRLGIIFMVYDSVQYSSVLFWEQRRFSKANGNEGCCTV